MENMRKVRKTMMKVLGYLIIFLFMMMTAVGSYQIITRYFFNRPSTVSEELLTYSFTWMSLLASAYVFGKRDHMRMGFMADKLTGNFRKYLEIIIDLLSFSFAAVVIRRLFYYKTDYDPDYSIFACANGVYIRDGACKRYPYYDFCGYERSGNVPS